MFLQCIHLVIGFFTSWSHIIHLTFFHHSRVFIVHVILRSSQLCQKAVIKLIYFYSLWKFLGIYYMRVLVLASLAVILFLFKS